MTGPSFATPAVPGTAPLPKPAASGARLTKPGEKPDDAAGLRVLTYLRLHWLMILFCGSLLGTAGAFTADSLLSSKYESYAMLQVSSVPTAIANNNPNQARTDFATYVKTTAALIKSEFVLNAALRDIKDLPTIKAQSDPLKYLDEEILVTRQDGSEVIRVTFKGHEPNDAKKIVDAIQKAARGYRATHSPESVWRSNWKGGLFLNQTRNVRVNSAARPLLVSIELWGSQVGGAG